MAPIRLNVYLCTSVQPTIYFPRHEVRLEPMRSLAGDLPSSQAAQARGVPLRLKIDFVRTPTLFGTKAVTRSVDRTTEVANMWSDQEIGRVFGRVFLPAGTYRVTTTLVDGAPELASLHPTFALPTQAVRQFGDCSEADE
jgi:hypothetical protein